MNGVESVTEIDVEGKAVGAAAIVRCEDEVSTACFQCTLLGSVNQLVSRGEIIDGVAPTIRSSPPQICVRESRSLVTLYTLLWNIKFDTPQIFCLGAAYTAFVGEKHIVVFPCRRCGRLDEELF